MVGNTLVDDARAMLVTIGDDYRVASNRVQGGDTGISIRGSGAVEDNEVTGAESRGVDIRANATVTLTGNTSCDNTEDLVVSSRANPTIDDTNTFCDLASAEDRSRRQPQT